MNSDGATQPTKLTNNTANDYTPSISGDGSKITFQPLSGEIFIINSDGSNLKQLTTNTVDDHNGAPSISADGSKIAFSLVVDDTYEEEIFLMQLSLPAAESGLSITTIAIIAAIIIVSITAVLYLIIRGRRNKQ